MRRIAARSIATYMVELSAVANWAPFCLVDDAVDLHHATTDGDPPIAIARGAGPQPAARAVFDAHAGQDASEGGASSRHPYAPARAATTSSRYATTPGIASSAL